MSTSGRQRVHDIPSSKDDIDINESIHHMESNGHSKIPPENYALFKTDSARNTASQFPGKAISRNNSLRESNIKDGFGKSASFYNNNNNPSHLNDCSAILEESPNIHVDSQGQQKILMARYGNEDDYDSDELTVTREEEETSNILSKMGKYQTKNFISSNAFTANNKAFKHYCRTSLSAESNIDDPFYSERKMKSSAVINEVIVVFNPQINSSLIHAAQIGYKNKQIFY